MAMMIGRQGFLLFLGGTLSTMFPAAAANISSNGGRAGIGLGSSKATGDAYAIMDSQGQLVGIHQPPAGGSVAPAAPALGTSGHSILPLSPEDYKGVMAEPTYFRPASPAR